MANPMFILSNQKEESISAKGVKPYLENNIAVVIGFDVV